jgi:hypothetical protein
LNEQVKQTCALRRASSRSSGAQPLAGPVRPRNRIRQRVAVEVVHYEAVPPELRVWFFDGPGWREAAVHGQPTRFRDRSATYNIAARMIVKEPAMTKLKVKSSCCAIELERERHGLN